MTFSKILTDQRNKKREGDVSSSHCNGVPMGNARSRMWMGVLVFGLLFLLTCSDNKDSGNGDNGNGNGDTTHKYSCTNGTAASGEATSEGTEKCASCKDGYKLTDAKSCVAIKYTCTNGTVKAGVPTTGNADVEFCTTCKSGYGIASNQCLMTTTINGTPGDDLLNGTPGPNIINGLAGEDVLNGLAGDDVLNGGDGDDTLNGGPGADVLDGGAGADTADYTDASARVVVYLKATDGSNEGEAAGDTYDNIENLSGSDHDDTLQGDDGPNTIVGSAGDDVLNGGDGSDLIYGQRGNDTIQGGNGNDDIRGGDGNDTIQGGSGEDSIQSGDGNDTIQGGSGDDDILSQGGADIMTGDGGNDIFELEVTYSEKDVITDFTKGDRIAVETSGGTENTLIALKAAAEIDWVNTADHPTGTTTNDSTANDTVISDTKGTSSTDDDVVIMVLEDYTGALVIGDFNVY